MFQQALPDDAEGKATDFLGDVFNYEVFMMLVQVGEIKVFSLHTLERQRF